MVPRVIRAIRRNIVAWLALFLALTGTSMAASRYIISSTGQIKPTVLKTLRGTRGATGATGAQGKEGPPGAAGADPARAEAGPRGESGPPGETGPRGAPGAVGARGERGESGPKGEAGTALAYAYISKTGEIEQADSKNVEGAHVETPEPGVYCISGLDFTPHNVVATMDANEPQLPLVSATVGVGKFAAQCNPETTQLTVETWVPTLARNKRGELEIVGETTDRAFYVAIN
jgi:Collagen triple helix repeat (20 copies)